MQVIELETVAPVNPFAADIQALAEMTEANPKAAGEFIVADDEVSKAKFKIGKAANAIDKTAALAIEEPGKDKGTTRLVYRLKARHRTGPRKTTAEVQADAAE